MIPLNTNERFNSLIPIKRKRTTILCRLVVYVKHSIPIKTYPELSFATWVFARLDEKRNGHKETKGAAASLAIERRSTKTVSL